jgi:hypothetical protein
MLTRVNDSREQPDYDGISLARHAPAETKGIIMHLTHETHSAPSGKMEFLSFQLGGLEYGLDFAR